MAKIQKDDVRKALADLEAASPDTIAKGEGAGLNPPEGAATGGGDGSLKAPGTAMSDAAPKGKGEVKKAEPPAAVADAGDADDGDDDDDDGEDDKAKKSMPSFRDNVPSEITTKVDVSTFLKSLVDHTATTVDGLRDALVKSDMANDARVTTLEERFDAVQKSLGNIGVVLGAICERIGVVENQPAAAPKSVVKSSAPAQPAAAPVERQFADANSAQTTEAAPQGLYKSLAGRPAHVQKSMIAEAMCELVRKGEAQDTDVINFETYGYIPGAIDAKLRAVL